MQAAGLATCAPPDVEMRDKDLGFLELNFNFNSAQPSCLSDVTVFPINSL